MATAYVIGDDGNEIVIANSDQTIRIEGNHYFPPESVNQDLLEDSRTHTSCYWKGEASYKTVRAGGKVLEDAAWYYPKPDPEAISKVGKDFSGYLAFWRGVSVRD